MNNDAMGGHQQHRASNEEQRYPPFPRSPGQPSTGRPQHYGPGGPPAQPFPGPPMPPGPQAYPPPASWPGHQPPQSGYGAPPSPPGWAPAGTGGHRGRWWLLWALAVIVVVAAVVGVVVVTSGGGSESAAPQATPTSTTVTSSSSAPLPISALDSLLLSPAEVADVVSAPTMVSLTKPEESHIFFNDHVVDNDCVGTIFAATQPFYQGSGWVSMRKLALADTEDNATKKHAVTEAVVAYADAGAATKFLDRAREVFHKCAGRNIDTRQVDDPSSTASFWTVGSASEEDGILSTSLISEGGDGWICRRGLSVHNNIVIDTSAYGYAVPVSVTPALIKPIAAKVESAR